MIPDIRRKKITELLKGRDVVFLPELIEQMGTSESTVRRDLKHMQMNGEVELLRGGGVQLAQRNVEMNIHLKMQMNEKEKLRIANLAASFIYPGDVLFMDPSSINFLLIDLLNDERVTVVTNSVIHMGKLLEKEMPCIFLGGQAKKKTMSCVGPLAEKMMSGLRFSKCFLGANGADVEKGITNHDPREQSIKQLAMSLSATTFFLIDSAKYGKTAMCRVAGLGDHRIITGEKWEGCEEYDNILVAPQ